MDTNFGPGGTVRTDFGGTDDEIYKALAIQSDGKIIAGGFSNALLGGSNYAFALARYSTSGSLDGTFGSGGKVLTSFGGTNDGASAVVIQADGKIVAGGGSNGSDVHGDFALARYNPNGSLNSTFGVGGKVVTDFSGAGSADSALALTIQADGKLVAAGFSNADGGHDDFALARYQSAPPVTITSLSVNPSTLWPPNHKMVSIHVSGTTSGGAGPVSCSITSVSSNEPIDPGGDWVFSGLALQLRADRSGNGTGRVYTITVQCSDTDGHRDTKTTTVTVPHDQGK